MITDELDRDFAAVWKSGNTSVVSHVQSKHKKTKEDKAAEKATAQQVYFII